MIGNYGYIYLNGCMLFECIYMIYLVNGCLKIDSDNGF